MSTETPAPFAPFPFAVPPVHPEQPPGVTTIVVPKKETAKQKKARLARENREAKAAAEAAKKTATEQPPKPPRKRKAAAADKKRAPKFELQTILAATAGLKEADMALFGKLLNLLTDENKAARARLLASLGKVFA